MGGFLAKREAITENVCVCVCVLCGQPCPTLCDPMDCSPPASYVHGISQARILQWVAISHFLLARLDPGIEPTSLTPPALAGNFFTMSATWEAPLQKMGRYIRHLNVPTHPSCHTTVL